MRIRTPSEVKWLLVERATVAGDLARYQDALQRLPLEISHLKARLQALDSTIALLDSSLKADAAGVVRRHTAEYKKRGALKAFIIDSLRGVAPGTLTTRGIVTAAVDHFGLKFESKAKWNAFFHGTVGRQIRLLEKEGLVEALHPYHASSAIWRWKDQQPTLQELLKLTSPS